MQVTEKSTVATDAVDLLPFSTALEEKLKKAAEAS
jgi:hypothetical protein